MSHLLQISIAKMSLGSFPSAVSPLTRPLYFSFRLRWPQNCGNDRTVQVMSKATNTTSLAYWVRKHSFGQKVQLRGQEWWRHMGFIKTGDLGQHDDLGVRVYADKPDGLSSTPRIHTTQGEKKLQNLFSASTCMQQYGSACVCTHMCSHSPQIRSELKIKERPSHMCLNLF